MTHQNYYSAKQSQTAITTDFVFIRFLNFDPAEQESSLTE